MLLHYLGKLVTSFDHFGRCFLRHVGGSEMSRSFNAEMRIPAWKWTFTAMIEVTTIGCHVGSKAFGEVCHRLVDVFLSQLFPDGLQSDFQLTNRFGFWLTRLSL